MPTATTAQLTQTDMTYAQLQLYQDINIGRPVSMGFDVYASGGVSSEILTQFEQLSQALSAYGYNSKPYQIFLQETQANSIEVANAIKTLAQTTGVQIKYVLQWTLATSSMNSNIADDVLDLNQFEQYLPQNQYIQANGGIYYMNSETSFFSRPIFVAH